MYLKNFLPLNVFKEFFSLSCLSRKTRKFTIFFMTKTIQVIESLERFCKYQDVFQVSLDFCFLNCLKNQAGIYGLWHPQTQKIYVGSAKNLKQRISDHFKYGYKSNCRVQNALQKHGPETFYVVILDYLGNSQTVTKKQLITREQQFLDLFPHDMLYNFLTQTHSSLGFRHTQATRQFLSDSRKGQKNPMWGLPKSPEFETWMHKSIQATLNPRWGSGWSLFVVSTDQTFSKLFYGFRAVEKSLHISGKTVRKYLKSGLPYFKKGCDFGYLFTLTPCTQILLNAGGDASQSTGLSRCLRWMECCI